MTSGLLLELLCSTADIPLLVLLPSFYSAVVPPSQCCCTPLPSPPPPNSVLLAHPRPTCQMMLHQNASDFNQNRLFQSPLYRRIHKNTTPTHISLNIHKAKIDTHTEAIFGFPVDGNESYQKKCSFHLGCWWNNHINGVHITFGFLKIWKNQMWEQFQEFVSLQNQLAVLQ